MQYGVPQTCARGPLLFSFYIQLLCRVILTDFHSYPDDAQLQSLVWPDTEVQLHKKTVKGLQA